MTKNHPFNKQSQKKVISFDISIYNEELELLHYDLLDFAFDNYDDFLYQNVEKQLAGLLDSQDEEEYEAYTSVLIAWAIMHLPVTKNNLTIFNLFKQNLKVKNVRKRTRKIIDQWDQSLPSAYQVIEMEKEYVLIEDISTAEQFKLKLIDEITLAINQLFIGTLIPFVDNYQFLFSAIEINSTLKGNLKSLLILFRDQKDFKYDFPAFIYEFMMMNPVASYKWENEIYKEAYQLFLEKNEAKDITMDETDEKMAKVKALHLLMQATEEYPLTRRKLIQDALKIDPNLPEAYLMLAEDALSIEEKMGYLKKTLEVSHSVIDPSFSEETHGNIWMQHEARTYLRAKELYAYYLIYYEGNTDAGIKHYQELLALNALDNQGIRYRLLTLYLETENYLAAENLLHDYNDEYTASFLFNKALLAYFKDGLIRETKQLLKEADEQNPYVKDYLLGRKEIPDSIDYIVLGEDSEAIEYVQENIHLWSDAQPLLESF